MNDDVAVLMKVLVPKVGFCLWNYDHKVKGI